MTEISSTDQYRSYRDVSSTLLGVEKGKAENVICRSDSTDAVISFF
jgi:hypothetical protein